ncbi:hypothetical protein ACFQ0G_19485 [Streptomyces chiangmaiensis]
MSLPARCLAAVQPVRAQFLEGADVDQWLVSDPRRAALVREYGIHSAIAVPLCARGALWERRCSCAMSGLIGSMPTIWSLPRR